MQIRVERPGDEAAISDLISAAFGKRDEAGLVDALRIGGTTPSLLSPKTEAT
jgi:predicted N-acetyltransferase YhbS